jgi:hypothetical protein
MNQKLSKLISIKEEFHRKYLEEKEEVERISHEVEEKRLDISEIK